VKVKAGVGSVRLEAPADAVVQVEVSGGAHEVDTEGVWDVEGNTYSTLGTEGPRMVIEVDISLGNLTLAAK
jgi:hypothetical protein